MLPRSCEGENLLAVGVTLYGTPSANGMGSSESDRTPMSACLYVEMADGSVVVLASGKEWKAALNAGPGWYEPKYDDSAWQNATAYIPPASPDEHGFNGKPLADRPGEVVAPQLRDQ